MRIWWRICVWYSNGNKLIRNRVQFVSRDMVTQWVMCIQYIQLPCAVVLCKRLICCALSYGICFAISIGTGEKESVICLYLCGLL